MRTSRPLTHEDVAQVLGGLAMRLDEEGEGRADGHGGGGAQVLRQDVLAIGHGRRFHGDAATKPRGDHRGALSLDGG